MIYELFLKFMIYAFLGWCMETVYCSAVRKRFVYRGFLYGPYCPIYGVGAKVINFVLGSVDTSPAADITLIFFGGMFLCSAVEYAASFLLEKLFGLTLWDYSSYPLNLKGRIWVGYSLWWGLVCVVLVKVIDPFVAGLLGRLTEKILIAAAVFLFVIIAADLTLTLLKFNSVKRGLAAMKALAKNIRERMQISVEGWADETKALLKSENETDADKLEYRRLARKLRKARLIEVFPRLKIRKLTDQLKELKNAFFGKNK